MSIVRPSIIQVTRSLTNKILDCDTSPRSCKCQTLDLVSNDKSLGDSLDLMTASVARDTGAIVSIIPRSVKDSPMTNVAGLVQIH
jgi:hypothetical protein